jgi:hypothetical protein
VRIALCQLPRGRIARDRTTIDRFEPAHTSAANCSGSNVTLLPPPPSTHRDTTQTGSPPSPGD